MTRWLYDLTDEMAWQFCELGMWNRWGWASDLGDWLYRVAERLAPAEEWPH
jgi:hypothetical protein